LLFLWNLFEGVPKFYRDCYEQGVPAADRPTLLRRIFFESSSPLRAEAENWFLRELRGRYDVVLKYVARNPGGMHNELVQAIREASGNLETQKLRAVLARAGVVVAITGMLMRGRRWWPDGGAGIKRAISCRPSPLSWSFWRALPPRRWLPNGTMLAYCSAKARLRYVV
jgi:hypothetical protein